MRLFLDAEFDGHGGDLISLALVPEHDHLRPFYVVVDYVTPTRDPWVAQHVIPVLNLAPVQRKEAARLCASYLFSIDRPNIIADWPADFVYLNDLFITGPRMCVPLPQFTMTDMPCVGFNTAEFSALPHNALEDAKALRDYIVYG